MFEAVDYFEQFEVFHEEDEGLEGEFPFVDDVERLVVFAGLDVGVEVVVVDLLEGVFGLVVGEDVLVPDLGIGVVDFGFSEF